MFEQWALATSFIPNDWPHNCEPRTSFRRLPFYRLERKSRTTTNEWISSSTNKFISLNSDKNRLVLCAGQNTNRMHLFNCSVSLEGGSRTKSVTWLITKQWKFHSFINSHPNSSYLSLPHARRIGRRLCDTFCNVFALTCHLIQSSKLLYVHRRRGTHTEWAWLDDTTGLSQFIIESHKPQAQWDDSSVVYGCMMNMIHTSHMSDCELLLV